MVGEPVDLACQGREKADAKARYFGFIAIQPNQQYQGLASDYTPTTKPILWTSLSDNPVHKLRSRYAKLCEFEVLIASTQID